MIYRLDVDVAGDRHPLTDTFWDAAEPVLRLGGYTVVDSASTGLAALSDSDCVIFCNPTEGVPLRSTESEFLKRALLLGVEVKPIALDATRRMPPDPAGRCQAFEVYDFQRRHNHKPDTVRPAAEAFARETLASTLPTCFPDRPKVFVSYSRQDGEDLARALDTELSADQIGVFRDLKMVRSGEAADDVIFDALDDCDALILLESPAACTSGAIGEELTRALERRIPIVWIQVDPGIERSAMLIPQPSGAPALTVTTAETDANPGVFAADVAQLMFEAFQPLVGSTMDELRALEAYGPESEVVVSPQSPRDLIYEIELPGPEPVVGPPRRERHLSQFFGRRPRLRDAQALEAWTTREFGVDVARHDATLVLDPLPLPGAQLGPAWRTSAREYRRALLDDTGRETIPRLLISGAFPDEPSTHLETKRCVADIAEEWFFNGGGIVMGGHPTFTPIVVGAAGARRARSAPHHLTIHQSAEFPDDQSQQFAGRARFVSTPRQTDRNASLTLMRERMFDADISAAVFIGGRDPRPGIVAGVDEELELAQRNGIPSLMLGAPGGRVASIIERLGSEPRSWVRLVRPPLDVDFVRNCAMRTDYRGISRELFGRVHP